LILRTIRWCDKHWDKIDDLHQETWIILIRRLPKLRLDPAVGTLRRWVLGIARRLAGWHAHRQSGQRDELLSADLLAALLDVEEGPISACERKDARDRVRAVLEEIGEHLSELSRRILVMRVIEEMKVPAIAAAFGISVGAVKMRLQRALREARDLLRKRGLGPS